MSALWSIPNPVDESWKDRARCRPGSGIDPEIFFVDNASGRPGPGRLDRIAEAQAICANCPVADACLEYSLAAKADHGVWGGVPDITRRRLKATRTRAAQRAAAKERELESCCIPMYVKE